MNSKRILFLLLLTSIKEIKSNILENNSLTNFNNQRENDIKYLLSRIKISKIIDIILYIK